MRDEAINTYIYSNTQFSINERKCTKTVKYKVKDSLEWWQRISEKRYDEYSYSWEDDFTMRLQSDFYHKENPKP